MAKTTKKEGAETTLQRCREGYLKMKIWYVALNRLYKRFNYKIEKSQDPEELFDCLLALLSWKFGCVREATSESGIEIEGVYYILLKENEFEKHRTNIDFLRKKLVEFENALVDSQKRLTNLEVTNEALRKEARAQNPRSS